MPDIRHLLRVYVYDTPERMPEGERRKIRFYHSHALQHIYTQNLIELDR